MNNRDYNWKDVRIYIDGREITGIKVYCHNIKVEKLKLMPTNILKEELSTAEESEDYEYCQEIFDELNKRTNK